MPKSWYVLFQDKTRQTNFLIFFSDTATGHFNEEEILCISIFVELLTQHILLGEPGKYNHQKSNEEQVQKCLG